MVVTEKVKLPDDSELDVGELNLTYPVLYSAAMYVGKKCEEVNDEFMLCKAEEENPIRCLNEGKAVAACALDFFKQLKKHCKEDFEKHVKCIDRTWEYDITDCQETLAPVDKCVLENLNIERPHHQYFIGYKVLDPSRPKPKETTEFPDPNPPLPKEKPEHPAKFGTRMTWWL